MVTMDPRLPALYVEAANLVGIDGPRDELIRLVDDGQKQLKVVSIVGFGGLGKTTLANQVFQKIGNQFDCQAFVQVSQKPNMRKILWSMLSKIKKEEDARIESRDEKWLIDALRDSLKNKRYLIVVDDAWSTEHWEIIKCGLPDNNYGSRIIVTTRNSDVAKFCCYPNPRHVYELRKLSEADSKTLFFSRIFGSEDRCPRHINEVSIDIIRRCGGLPLAIITMASLLSTKSEATQEWISVRKMIGSGLEKHPSVLKMNKILSLSYNDLPCHLKTCLLYLNIYPEDHEIKMDNLVRMWITEGFINAYGGRSLQEVGISYFNELINRSMILPADINYDGQAISCRVHDMILDLIVCKSSEENFVTCVGDNEHVSFPSQEKVRRLSIHYVGHENITLSSTGTGHVRSLSVFGSCEAIPSLLDFRSMRVLSVESTTKLSNSFNNIGKLFLLRYLEIKARGFTRLPEEIGQLHVLETLDVYYTDVRQLPASISELQQLKLLHVFKVKLPYHAVSKMKALEGISYILVDKSTSIIDLQELGSLTNLRFLELIWQMSGLEYSDMIAHQETFFSSISKLCKSSLRSLQINGGDALPLDFIFASWYPPPHLLQKLRLEGVVTKIPGWMASLTNLTSLHIQMVQLRQETINILGSMHGLASLWLQDEHYAAERIIIGSDGFRCLMHLYISLEVNSVTTALFEAGAMPKLWKLVLHIQLADEAIGATASSSSVTDLGISHLLALRNITFRTNFVWSEEAKALNAAIRNAASLLPNHPTTDICIL